MSLWLVIFRLSLWHTRACISGGEVMYFSDETFVMFFVCFEIGIQYGVERLYTWKYGIFWIFMKKREIVNDFS